MQESIESLKEKAQAGDAKAQYNLGKIYYNGKGVPKNDIEAAKWFRKAAEQGHAGAQYSLSQMCEKGEGVPQNYAEALKWSQEARKTTDEQGDAETQFKMGVMYRDGKGVPKDYEEAAKWFQKAAEQGHAEAQNELGCMYANGEGVRQDYDKAARWLWKAKQGDDKSPQVKKLLIALMYSAGGRVQQNEVEAYAWVLLFLKENADKKDSELISSFKEDLTAEQMEKGQARAAELHRLIGLIE